MTALRAGLPPLPPRFRSLPIDERGYPVPAFVAIVDGKPDHRVMNAQYLEHCIRFRSCWLCGQTLGKFGSFVIGPMCAINRASAEPPSHLDCADFAARACPFMVRPMAKRREHGLPPLEERVHAGGAMLRRNPGVVLVWTSKTWEPFFADATPGGGQAGVLHDIGEPHELKWYAEGRPATRAEVLESVESGCPLLEEQAAKDGPEAIVLLARLRKAAERLYPAEARA